VGNARPGLRFEPEWRLTLVTLVLLPVLVSLGMWQLQRAGEKKVLAAAFEERRQQPPAPLSALWDESADSLAYRRVRLSAQFTPGRYFLLDNSVRGGRFGYEVLAIAETERGSVLVNRGWTAGDSTRRSLPRVPELAGTQELVGHVYVSPGRPYLLVEQQFAEGWPKLVQALEMEKLIPLVGGAVFAYPVRLDEGQPGALVTDWRIVNVSPEKHRGYAMQWFTMASVLLVLYLLRCTNLWAVMTWRRSDGE